MIRSLLCTVSLLAVVPAIAAEDFDVLGEQVDGVEPGKMVHAYLLDQAFEALDRRDA